MGTGALGPRDALRALDRDRRPPQPAVRVPSGPPSPPRRALSDNVIRLQHAVGNRAVGALLRSPTGQSSSAPPTDAPVADPWAGMIEDARAKRWAKVVDQLMSLPIESLLDALERLRESDLLSALRIELPLMPIERTARFDAAMLAISNLSTDERLEWRRKQQLISEDELKALQARKRKWLESGTAADASPVRRWDYQTYSPYKGGQDGPTGCVGGTFDPKFASQKPEDWLSGFLDFYEFQPPPIHDPSNTGVLFNHKATIVEEVVDLAYEHWLYSSTQLWIPTYVDESDITSANTSFFLTREKIDSLVRKLYQDRRGAAESRNLTFQITWPATYHQNIWNAKSGRDSLQMVTAQIGITWQMHHDDEPGSEYQGFAQLQFGKYLDEPDEAAKLQQVMLGFQYAWVVPLLEQAAQAQFFAQLLAGGTNMNSPDTGAGGQEAVGVQMSINVPYTKGHVQLVGVVQGSLTETVPFHGKPGVTGDVQSQLGLIVKIYQW